MLSVVSAVTDQGQRDLSGITVVVACVAVGGGVGGGVDSIGAVVLVDTPLVMVLVLPGPCW